jgi:hypothetical protein
MIYRIFVNEVFTLIVDKELRYDVENNRYPEPMVYIGPYGGVLKTGIDGNYFDQHLKEVKWQK